MVRKTGIGGVVSGAGVRVGTGAKSWGWRWSHVPVLSRNRGCEGLYQRADGMASKVGRSQLLGLSSFEVPEQTCFAWNRCSPWLFLWDSSVYCPASSLFHTLPRVMLKTQCPPTPPPRPPSFVWFYALDRGEWAGESYLYGPQQLLIVE